MFGRVFNRFFPLNPEVSERSEGFGEKKTKRGGIRIREGLFAPRFWLGTMFGHVPLFRINRHYRWLAFSALSCFLFRGNIN